MSAIYFYFFLQKLTIMAFKDIVSGVGSALGAVNPILGLAGSIFGGLLGKKGQDSANDMNLQIARETNQANRENQEYQNQWNMNMWNTQNEYNSPLAQRQRLEDAGLNPIFFGLDGNGNAGALQSASFTAVPGAPMSNSGSFLGAGLMNAAKTSAEIQLIKSQAKKTEAETKNQDILNFIQQATAGDIIEGAHYNMLVTKGNVAVTENKAKLLNRQFDEIGAHISEMNAHAQSLLENIDISKFNSIMSAYFESRNIDLKYRELLQNGFFDYIRAVQENKRIGILASVAGAQIKVFNAQAENISEDTRRRKYDNDFREETQPIYDSSGHPTVFTQNHARANYIESKVRYNNAINSWEFRNEFLFASLAAAEQISLVNRNIKSVTENQEFRNDFNLLDMLFNDAASVAQTVRGVDFSSPKKPIGFGR